VAADPDAVEVDGIVYRWRAPVADSDVVDLHAAAFPGSADSEPSWWRRQRPLSLGWVTAHAGDRLVGFANLAWDGHRHSFLLDVAVHPDHRRRNIGSTVIERAVAEGRAAGCEWLHVDFEPHLARFYQRAGFLPTAAGLRRLM
jgi:GNAT superfamily N-acetyltransferase